MGKTKIYCLLIIARLVIACRLPSAYVVIISCKFYKKISLFNSFMPSNVYTIFKACNLIVLEWLTSLKPLAAVSSTVATSRNNGLSSIMKNSYLTLIFIAFIASESFAGKDLLVIESMVMHSKILKQDVRFSVCLPTNYYSDSTVRFPVVYMLHGLGDNDAAWLEYGNMSGLADRAVEGGGAIPMIYIMPEAYRTYYVNDYAGTFMYQDMFIKELVPAIDSIFRTRAERSQRALVGYSMGGFGALILHLMHPEVFGTSVPLSISVRTDQQYITEDASGWDDQWGRLFGAPGLTGKERITQYYKENSPFHLLPTLTREQAGRLNIYILNGDDEQTLCRSNEELHILMNSLGIKHEYRVVDGGHSFRVWSAAMPNALRFISDSFEGKAYRGDYKEVDATRNLGASLAYPQMTSLSAIDSIAIEATSSMQEIESNVWLEMGNPTMDVTTVESTPGPKDSKTFTDRHSSTQSVSLEIGGIWLNAFLPEDYSLSNRKYPVLYLLGDFNMAQTAAIGEMINTQVDADKACPMILVALPSGHRPLELIMIIEKELRIREGYKMRAIAATGGQGIIAFDMALNEMQFNVCILMDAYLQMDVVKGMLKVKSTSGTSLQTSLEASDQVPAEPSENLKKTRFYIDAPSGGNHAEGNGSLHMILRDLDLQHEYRVTEGNGGFEWQLERLVEAIRYTALNFHR